MFREISKEVDSTDLSALLEKAALEFPTSYPNPVEDFGSFTRFAGNPIVTFDPVTEDRMMPCDIKADPRRNRILMLAHHRTAGVANNNGRQLFLWSAPWDSPAGPWTRINDHAHPLVALGPNTDWDGGDVYNASMVIRGDTLYIAYSGDAVNAHQHLRIGLATANLTAAVPQATKLTTGVGNAGPLALGTAPYQAWKPSLHYLNGRWHLWVKSDTSADAAAYMMYPRLYTNPVFAKAGWAIHPAAKNYGQTDTAIDAFFQMLPLDNTGDNWLHATYNGTPNTFTLATYGFRHDRVRWNMFAGIFTNNNPDGTARTAWDKDYVDQPVLFYHLGKWYMFYGGNNAGAGVGTGAQGGGAVYDYAVQQSQTGVTPNTFDLLTQRKVTAVVNSYATGGQLYTNSTSMMWRIDQCLLETPSSVGYLSSINHITGDSSDFADGVFRIFVRYPTVAHQHTYSASPTDANTAAVGSEITAGANPNISHRVWIVGAPY